MKIKKNIKFVLNEEVFVFLNMLFRYCCPLKSLNVLKSKINKQTNKAFQKVFENLRNGDHWKYKNQKPSENQENIRTGPIKIYHRFL